MSTSTVTVTYNDTVIAESSNCEVVEGNYYFPESDVNFDYLTATDLTTVCGWKGTANYYTIKVGDSEAKNAVWQYSSPKSAAENIKKYLAFYKSKVEITTA
eukprot:TRINITY_DN1177_c0_g1_i1.p1 TRINITY_DN1177_c0_g1~~TRINITY_DN1177_c0_g1_i1.p1  ORF type:complete len:101 (+),score=45.12 TRINITY_DN1177_c0_g1_i1:119-421(+)